MEINDAGLPIHEDATAKIRPRIFLEGNFFVDLKPGTPDGRVLDSGETIKITQTATPVQLDQVLTSLQSDSREDLTALLDGLSTALNSKPTPAQDRDNHELAKGQSAAESFNDAYDDIPDAERSSAIVFEALLGTEPGRDVARLIRGTAQHRRGAEPLREPAPGPDHEPQPDDGRVRVGVHEPARVDPRAGADAAQRQRRIRLAQRGVPVHARVRDRDPARRARDAGHDRGRVPVDRADPRAGRARTSWAGWPRSSRPPPPTWRG